jgi:hypothetical protein
MTGAKEAKAEKKSEEALRSGLVCVPPAAGGASSFIRSLIKLCCRLQTQTKARKRGKGENLEWMMHLHDGYPDSGIAPPSPPASLIRLDLLVPSPFSQQQQRKRASAFGTSHHHHHNWLFKVGPEYKHLLTSRHKISARFDVCSTCSLALATRGKKKEAMRAHARTVPGYGTETEEV